ncbi:MAG: DUF1592 domain-containing protein [Planctomycetes bacterium]|nr:DUF1592 domain-containing protein [Planctomycetota bacterium]
MSSPSTFACLALLALVLAPARDVASAPDAFTSSVRPFLERHCVACHSGDDAERGLRLDTFADEPAALAQAATWANARERVLAGEMPPPKKVRPSTKERDAFVGWIDARFFRLKDGGVDPGRPTLRRLNRAQYANTVRDLFGVEFRADVEFPGDDVGYGFDSIGDVLATSDVLLEKYLSAAERVAAAAVVLDECGQAPVERVAGADLERSQGNGPSGKASVLFANSAVLLKRSVPREGEFVLRIRAAGDQAGPEKVRMAVRVGEKEVERFEVAGERGDAATFTVRLRLDAGSRSIGVAFLNDYYAPEAADPGERDRNLVVEWVELEGPLDAPVLSAFQRRWLADAKADRKRVLAGIAKRVWRRPATSTELDRLAALAPAGAPLARAVREALVALLVSPHFLFRVEDDARKPAKNGVRALDEWELATRLAYFLWNSAPDDALVARCEKKELARADVLAAEVERMLRDPRATELARDFATQWLQIRALDRSAPDPARFPRFDEELRVAMRAETELFFDAVLRERRPVSELLLADFTFLNEPLAAHYGVPGVHGKEMRRVRLEPGARNGLLGHGSVLTVTSNPTRTSPVKRGKWVLDVLLAAPPPPPPPGVGDLNESKQAVDAASLRERLLEHRKNPSCGACHDRFDPLGFALENFDATGAWRERDGGFPIDASGDLPDGTRLGGAADLRAELTRDPRFVRALVKKLMTYALGRGLGPADDPSIDAVLAPFAGKDPALADLILGIVRSKPFLERRVEG